jgi:hypothetical protein
MLHRICKGCDKIYIALDGAPDTGFCSDLCFGNYSIREKGASAWPRLLTLLVVGGLGVAGYFHVEVAREILVAFPDGASPASRHLAGQGAAGTAALLDVILERDGRSRSAAIAALELVDPLEAHPLVQSKLPSLRKLLDKLEHEDANNLFAGLGRCKITEEAQTFLSAVEWHERQEGALRALGHLGDPSHLSVVRSVLDTAEGRPAPTVAAAAFAAGRLSDKELTSLTPVLSLLKHEDPRVRASAATAVGNLCADMKDIELKLGHAPLEDQPPLRYRLRQREAAYSQLYSAGAAEKVAETKARMADAVTLVSRANRPVWAP